MAATQKFSSTKGFEPVSAFDVEGVGHVTCEQAEAMGAMFRTIARLTTDREIIGICRHGALQADLQSNDIDAIIERTNRAGLVGSQSRANSRPPIPDRNSSVANTAPQPAFNVALAAMHLEQINAKFNIIQAIATAAGKMYTGDDEHRPQAFLFQQIQDLAGESSDCYALQDLLGGCH